MLLCRVHAQDKRKTLSGDMFPCRNWRFVGASRRAQFNARKCGTDALTPIRLGRSVRFLRTQVEAFEMAHESQLERAKHSLD
jgi:hypothetical protein